MQLSICLKMIILRQGEKLAVRELIVFKHSKELGDCPAYKLFDAVEVKKNETVEYPRKYQEL